MEFSKLNDFSDSRFDESLNFKEIVEKYASHLKWFIASAILFGVLGYLYVLKQAPEYSVTSTILINEQEKGTSITDMSDFESMGLFNSSGRRLENEIQILRSRRLMEKVVDELNLNVSYFLEGNFYDQEFFPSYPVLLNLDIKEEELNKMSTRFKLAILSSTKFEFFDFNNDSYGVKEFGQEFKADLGNENRSNPQTFKISRTDFFNDDLIGESIQVKVSSLSSTVSSLNNKMEIFPSEEKLSKVLFIAYEDKNVDKGKAIVNNLIQQYNADGISDKNEINLATTEFLDLRINLLSEELAAIEGTAEQFKTSKGVVDVTAGTDIFLQSSSTNERDMVAANTEKQLVDYMRDVLANSELGQLLPGNIGLSDASIVRMIAEYNQLILQRNRVLKSSSTLNPIIVGIDSQLKVLRSNLIGSLENLSSSLAIRIEALNKQSGRISSRIASVPKNEREFKNIVREQETKNALYLFLLQKREESILAAAVNTNKAKVIDQAYSTGIPISPQKTLVLSGFILMGLFIPFLTIYTRDLLDSKIHNEKDLSGLDIPYLGDIPFEKNRKDLFINEKSNTMIAEAFRYLRTNISFMLDDKKVGTTILFTSSLSGEGKTYAAINLARSLVLSNKHVVLVAMDLRAPKIMKYLDIKEKPKLGLTNFIKHHSLRTQDIIVKDILFDGLDFVHSGDIPPNPVELLMSDRVEEFFSFLKNTYDYIIVDSAPVGMVTDTLQISSYIDLSIYVIKANFLDKRMLHIPHKMDRENKLKNMAILLNGTDHDKGAYGYGYGYGHKEEKPWYKTLFDFN
jgi:capsular exopolysaccharide synthesis family protein